jgi:hypothetical protein
MTIYPIKYKSEQYSIKADAKKRLLLLKSSGVEATMFPIRSYWIVRYAMLRGIGERKRLAEFERKLKR